MPPLNISAGVSGSKDWRAQNQCGRGLRAGDEALPLWTILDHWEEESSEWEYSTCAYICGKTLADCFSLSQNISIDFQRILRAYLSTRLKFVRSLNKVVLADVLYVSCLRRIQGDQPPTPAQEDHEITELFKTFANGIFNTMFMQYSIHVCMYGYGMIDWLNVLWCSQRTGSLKRNPS